jgi:predicted nucleotidyltransferase
MSEPRLAASLLAQTREVSAAIEAAGLRYMLVGGLAVNIHGYLRATRDLDLMLMVEDTQAVDALLGELGYEALDRRLDLHSYLRGTQRLDILFARRPISRGLLERAAMTSFDGGEVPVISLEGLLGLKIQAFNDDMRRLGDLKDMLELVRANLGRFDEEEVRSYFRLFDRERVFDDIIRALGRAGPQGAG